MKVVKNIEKMLGTPFGLIPSIRRDTAKNRAQIYHDVLNTTGDESPADDLRRDELEGISAYYQPHTHTILRKVSDNPAQDDYFLVHELTHGFCYSNYPFRIKTRIDLHAQFGLPMKKRNYASLEAGLVCMTVDEGLAEYVAVQYNRKFSPTSQIWRSRDEMYLSCLKNMMGKQDDFESFPEMLSRFPKSALFNGEKLFHDFKGDCREAKDMSKPFQDFEPYIYVLGYFSMRSYFHDESDNIGQHLNRLLADAPKTFKELRQRCE